MSSKFAGRSLRSMFVFVMVVSLVFSNTGLKPIPMAYAQGEDTPTVTPDTVLTATPEVTATAAPATEIPTQEVLTETPVDLPVITEEPTTEQTLGSLPNLSLAAPEGWDASVVLSQTMGTHSTETLTDGEVAYLDLAVLNQGGAADEPFTVCLKIDGEQVQCWEANGLSDGESFIVEDWAYTANRGAGSHRVEVIVDPNNAISESDETDNTWKFDYTWLPSDVAGLSAGSPLVNDARERPNMPGMQGLSATDSNLPGLYDVSVFMIGSVAVGVILPESSGPNSTEDWTVTERDQVYAQIQEGLTRWENWSKVNIPARPDTNKDNVDADVSFVYDYHFQVNTTYEPIKGSSDACAWISNVLTNMGYAGPGNCWDQVYQYLDALRIAKGTNWATVIFVVDSSVDTDGMFNDGVFAFSYVHGPYMVMTYDNKDWGIDRMDVVAQHELAHIFGAGDNYSDQVNNLGCFSTTEPFGYLGIPNSNCAYNNSSADTNVLMNNYNTSRIHSSTQYQIGWKDLDHDLVPDPVDTIPRFSMGAIQSNYTVSGAIYDEPFSTTNYWGDITINKITSARYRVDTGDWQDVAALDGSIDSDHEDVLLNLGTLSNGTHALYVELKNSQENTYVTAKSFTVPLTSPTNDRLANAVPMVLDTEYTQTSGGATITTDEPVNACNTVDTGSVWYSFTAPSTGIYKLNVYGSDYSPNLSVVRKVSSSVLTPVVCGETRPDSSYGESELAFNATSGYTYLFEVSDAVGGGTLTLKLEKPECSTVDLCGAVVGGDGRVVHYPTMSIGAQNGNDLGKGYGDYSGFINGQLNTPVTANYKVITTGESNIIVNTNVRVPGYFSPSAIGLPKTLVNVRDLSGNLLTVDDIVMVSSSDRSIGGFIGGATAEEPRAVYAPAGTYNFFASSNDAGLEVYQPGINIVSTVNPGTVSLDASILPRDTFTFDVDGITDNNVWIYSPDYFGHLVQVDADRTITFAAPVNTQIPTIDFEITAEDMSTLTWGYRMTLDGATIAGGQDHSYQVGGALSVEPYASNPLIRLDEGKGKIYAGIEDAYGNKIIDVYKQSYFSTGVSAKTAQDRSKLIDGLTISTTEAGELLHRSLPGTAAVTAQDWVWENVVPTYQLTDGLGASVVTEPVANLNDPMSFNLLLTSKVGTWHIEETFNFGPYGGEKSGTGSFEVYSLASHPLANDDFNTPITISTLPYSITNLDTLGGTQANDDPIIPVLNSRGYASAWFKYKPTIDSFLTLDTLGSDYDTVLTVWQGVRGSLKNLAYNNDLSDVEKTSKLELAVRAGQTYYIEVTQYSDKSTENPSVQSLEVSSNSNNAIEMQSIGGKLTLNASMIPCHSLTVTTNSTSSGTVSISPAPNCLGTKYTHNSEIKLTATSKPTFGFLKWSDDTADSPYAFNIEKNEVFQASFVSILAPFLTSPDTGWYTADTTPDFAWNAVEYGDTYEIQIDNQSTFAAPIDQTATGLDLSYTATPLTDGLKYWRVRAINYRGEPGAWSASRSFTVVTTPPDAPALSSPVDGVTVRGTPKYSWLAATGGKFYQFEYAASSDFLTGKYTSPDLVGLYFTPPTQAPGTYFWHVRAKNEVDLWGDWSATRQIIIDPLVPLAPALTAPSTGLLTSDNTPVFNWNAVIYGNTYEIQIDNLSSFAAPIEQTTIVGTLSYTATPLTDGLKYWRVRAINTKGELSPWSSVRTFTVDTVPPAAPKLASPSTGVTVRGTPKYSWLSATGAKYYQFEYSISSDFSGEVYTSPDLTVLYFTPPTQAPGTYYWRARAKDLAGNLSVSGDVRQITILPLKPVAPVLLSPTSGFYTNDATPAFSWKAVPYGDRYQVQISKTSSFILPLQDVTLGSGILSYTADSLLDGLMYWRVRAININNEIGTWSSPRTFTVDTIAPSAPKLSVPASGVLPYRGTPKYVWLAASGGKYYQFEYAESSDFLTAPYTSTYTTSLYITPPIQAPNKIYYWHVRAKDAAGNEGAWSDTRQINIIPLKPVAPVLLLPSTGFYSKNDPFALSWKAVPYGDRYQVQISKLSSFILPSKDVTLDSGILTYTVPPVTDGDGTKYWRVRAINVNGELGSWSSYRTFIVDTVPPAAARLSSPLAGVTVRGTPKYSWPSVSGAKYYQFEYSTSSDFSSVVYTSGDLIVLYITPPLQAPGTYYWRVRAKDAAGNWGSWPAEIRQINVLPSIPTAPSLLTPASSGTVATAKPTFSWKPVLYGTEYELQIDNSSTFTTPEVSGTIAGTSFSAGYLKNGTYYWRVRARNANNEVGAWSSVRTVKIAAP